MSAFRPLLQQLAEVRESNCYTLFPRFQSSDGAIAWIDGKRHIVLVANNYLGLANDPRVQQRAQEAIGRFGTSGCGSPLSTGYTEIHAELEGRLAAFLKQDSAIVFPSGYQTNVGVIAALMRRGDLILSDLFNHASIVDGARLSGAELRFFDHNDAGHLRDVLSRMSAQRRALVIVEGIYSVDGDVARLPEICEAAHARGALVMLDEAHSLGVLGAGGRGAAEHFDLLGEVDLIMGTMSKSLASVGGFVAGDAELIDVVRHSARSLVFSAALPTAAAAAALAALELLQSEPRRRECLWRNTHHVLRRLTASGFDTMRSVSPVIPILIGAPQRTLEFTMRVQERGVLVCPVVPPMVQGHLSRVRAHVTASHDPAMLDEAMAVLQEVGHDLGICRDRLPVAE